MANISPLYWDLLVTDEDLTLDVAGMAIRCNNQESIAQDMKHCLLESGLITDLIGARSRILRNDIYLQMILLLEEDERLVAGSIDITEQTIESLLITANSVEWGEIAITLNTNEGKQRNE